MAAVETVIGRLPDEFRTRADELEAYAPPAAVALREAAARVERALEDAAAETLTLAEASKVSGYSVDHLGRLIAQKKLRNVGRRHAPRVLRGELPIKPRPVLPTPRPAPAPVAAAPDAAPMDVVAIGRAIAARGTGRSASLRGRRGQS